MFVIIGVVLVLGLIGGVAGVNWYFDNRKEVSNSRGSVWTPRPTDEPRTTRAPRSSEPETTEPPTTAPPRTTRPPTKRPTTQPPTKKPPTKKPVPEHLRPQRGYEEVPLPSYGSDLEEAARIARDNSLYREKVSKYKCSNLPNLSFSRPYPSLSEKKLRKGLQTMADCMAGMWRKPAAKAGFQATKIKVSTYLGSARSPCGSSNAPAFYCSANQHIYFSKGLGWGRRSQHEWAHYFDVMGHEYGHHLQARTGVLRAANWHESNTSKKESLEIQRRVELQATCFGGMAMKQTGEVGRSYHRELAGRYYGDAVHGTREHIYAWAVQGYRHREVFQCNTFRASSKDVR